MRIKDLKSKLCFINGRIEYYTFLLTGSFLLVVLLFIILLLGVCIFKDYAGPISAVLALFAALFAFRQAYMVKEQLEILKMKPRLDLEVYIENITQLGINQGYTCCKGEMKSIRLTFLIVNNGEGIAKYPNLQVSFFNREVIEITNMGNFTHLERVLDKLILEYNGSIENVVYAGHRLSVENVYICVPKEIENLSIGYSLLAENFKLLNVFGRLNLKTGKLMTE